MKVKTDVFLVLLIVAASIAAAQSVPPVQSPGPETPVNGYWIDPTSGLMWAGKDNGKDVNWHKAMKYCQNLRLAGFSDWRLGTIDELFGIYDRSADSPGRFGNGEPNYQHVKGSLFLTGVQWSSSQRIDDRGRTDDFAWFYDFINGRRGEEDATNFSGRYANRGMRALCVRGPVK